MKNIYIKTIIVFIVIVAFNCKKDRGINLFTKEQDIEFGKQMKNHIDSSADFNVLDPVEYEEAYQHLNRIVNTILTSSDNFENKDVFNWEAYIIDDDVLNAFACPGGYMYFYTGLIKYLENEAEFAGVVAHEMAHVELRHSTRQMTDQFGYSFLLNILLGKPDSRIDTVVAGVATGLVGLKFSRNHESQSDEYAVKFLSDTDYDPRGVAGFFEKLDSLNDGGSEIPVFLRTHPLEEDRIDNIYNVWKEEGGKVGETYPERYREFQNLLPE